MKKRSGVMENILLKIIDPAVLKVNKIIITKFDKW